MVANVITGCRIVCSVFLLCSPVFSNAFYVLYLLAGFTDMLDGFVARKTNTASEMGAKLDTIADFIFVMACLIKLLPAQPVPAYLLIWTAIIGIIKAINIISGFVVEKKFVAVHSACNKFTGLLLFLFPLSLPYMDLNYSGCIVCMAATFAAIQEGHLIRTGQY